MSSRNETLLHLLSFCAGAPRSRTGLWSVRQGQQPQPPVSCRFDEDALMVAGPRGRLGGEKATVERGVNSGPADGAYRRAFAWFRKSGHVQP